MKEIKVTGFCYGDTGNHKKCYFFREFGATKFCGLWMRNVSGVFNKKKRQFKCIFCNASSVVIESKGGPAFIDGATLPEQDGRSIGAI